MELEAPQAVARNQVGRFHTAGSLGRVPGETGRPLDRLDAALLKFRHVRKISSQHHRRIGFLTSILHESELVY